MTETPMRILAIDPSTRGFGFAVFEGPDRLIDWGLVHVGHAKNDECLKRLEDLMGLYAPWGFVAEDCWDPGSRRRPRTHTLINQALEYAAFFDRHVIAVPWRTVRVVVGGSPKATKEEVAQAVARRFPEIAHRLPPHRKPWMSEDARMSLFDAVALGVAALEDTRRRSHAARPEAQASNGEAESSSETGGSGSQ